MADVVDLTATGTGDVSVDAAGTSRAPARSGSDTSPADVVAEALAAIRAQLAEIDELPLEQRVERFGQINAAIVAQLAELDEL